MSNPDISPVGFAATDHPRSPLERRHSTPLLVAGALLIVGGLAAMGYFVLDVFDPTSDPDSDAVAQSLVGGLEGPATPAAEFDVAEAGPYTVWLDTGDVLNSVTRETIVAAANCEATFADGTSRSFRGAIQGSSVVLGDLATIGTFDAPEGHAEVTCHSERFGRRAVRDRLEEQREFFVSPGSPGAGWASWVGFFAGIPAIILGIYAIGRGWTGTVRTRKRRTRGSAAPHEG